MLSYDFMKGGPYRSAIRVTPESLDMARLLVEYVSQHGWASLGLPRKDPPSLTNVVEEALKLLEQRKRGSKKK
jgi:hypothetical protein